tara:strand:- start:1255 stop:1794 length:540 start_codon:yes stop_codon:yes gene_type:complete
MEIVRILDEMSRLGFRLAKAWETDGNRDADLFSTWPFKCSLDEWPLEVEQLSREYQCLPEDHNDDLNPGEIIEELVAQMGGEADKDNIDQQVAMQRAAAYLDANAGAASAESEPVETPHAPLIDGELLTDTINVLKVAQDKLTDVPDDEEGGDVMNIYDVLETLHGRLWKASRSNRLGD